MPILPALTVVISAALLVLSQSMSIAHAATSTTTANSSTSTTNANLELSNADKTLRVLSGLKAMGIRIAIDDFGIGYSSLSTLKQFPLDTIKIDRSFIRNAASFAEDKAVTEAIVAMGRTLSLNVVAQGVETKEQADFLCQNACDEFQGFYLSKPVPANEIAQLLRTQSDIANTVTDPAD